MFDNLKIRFERNFVRIDQLRKYVSLGKITEDEFKIISSTSY